nr:uncharacterized protein LOC127341473 isoform X2 [Lolium perenne]
MPPWCRPCRSPLSRDHYEGPHAPISSSPGPLAAPVLLPRTSSMGFLMGACSGDGIPLLFSSPLWTSAGVEHGEEGHLAEFHRPAMVAASPAAPLAIGAPTPPRTAEQGGRGWRATRPLVDLGGVWFPLRDREIQIVPCLGVFAPSRWTLKGSSSSALQPG